ncbi:hypothetical protein DRJ25_06220 [Candidatus Woesearchaeota archaeon]|nr:MAG: hypothetical protein DRJ25_06220 [Candidatus Woesearchaeota archaeon]
MSDDLNKARINKARKKINEIIVQEEFLAEDEDSLFDILEILENYLDGRNSTTSFSDEGYAVLKKYDVDIPSSPNDESNLLVDVDKTSIKVFLSYRRKDSAAFTGRLHERLIGKLSTDGSVFFDIEEINLGEKFPERIQDALQKSNIFIPVIGDEWLHITDSDNKRRLDNPEDWVRKEVEFALDQEDCVVIPVLIDDTQMPTKDELPKRLKNLSSRNAITIRNNKFRVDTETLIQEIQNWYKKWKEDAPPSEQEVWASVDDAMKWVESGKEELIQRGLLELGFLARDENNFVQSSLLQAKVLESKVFENLRNEINTHLEQNDYTKAKEVLERLKDLRPNSLKIEEWSRIIAQKKSQTQEKNETREAKSLLKRHDDYTILLKGIKLARGILKGKGDNDTSVTELRVLFDEAEKVRGQISAKLDAAQTMGAMRKYRALVKTYADLMNEGIIFVEFPLGSGEKVRIAELHSRALRNLRKPQENTVQNRCTKAKDVLDYDPQLAQMYLEELSPFIDEFKGQEIYNRYTDIRVQVEHNLIAWKKADEYVKETIGLSPRERIQKYEYAKLSFPAYPDLDEKIEEAKYEIRQETALSVREKLEQIEIDYNFQRTDVDFEHFLHTYQEIRRELFEFGKPEGELRKLEQAIETKVEQLRAQQYRYEKIKDTARLIEKEYEGGADIYYMRELLSSLPTEDKDHIFLSKARSLIARLNNLGNHKNEE